MTDAEIKRIAEAAARDVEKRAYFADGDSDFNHKKASDVIADAIRRGLREAESEKLEAES